MKKLKTNKQLNAALDELQKEISKIKKEFGELKAQEKFCNYISKLEKGYIQIVPTPEKELEKTEEYILLDESKQSVTSSDVKSTANIPQETTDKLFNAITSNGCREMDEIRFNQAVNEALIIYSNPLYEAIQRVKDKYPLDIFPKYGESQDCKSAEISRRTCDNIREELDKIINND